MKKYFQELLEDFIQALDELSTESTTFIDDMFFAGKTPQRINNSNEIEVIDLSNF